MDATTPRADVTARQDGTRALLMRLWRDHVRHHKPRLLLVLVLTALMAGATKGWSFPVFEELWNYGFPQEMEHFADCVRSGRVPVENGQDGRAVVEIVCALYASAGEGRRVELPFPCNARRPIDLWRRR